MANITKQTGPNSLTGRIAAEKPRNGNDSELKTRVASAWTLAKTMLPQAPYEAQMKFATAQLQLPTRMLTSALRQTAVNAHYTRVGSKLEEVHKCDLNDLLEDPSILTKETSAVQSELKGDAKTAAGKKADDRKEAGPLPAEYPEPKRDEPKELDGSNAAKRPALTEKESSVKKAHGKDCKGCPDCDTEKKDDKKASSKKKAEDETPAPFPPAEDAPAEDAAPAEGEEAPAEDAPADDAPFEGDDDTEETPAAEEEPFDEEKADLQDAIDQLKPDIEALEEAVSEFDANAEDISFDDDETVEGEADELGDIFADGEETGELNEAEAIQEHADEEGEELNLDDLFNNDNMTDKVSALNDEDLIDLEENDGVDFFAPSDPAELESVLEDEEGLMSPADMFNMHGVDDDPMARIFASRKAASEEGVVEPGTLDSFFESEIKGEDRDAEFDHDGDIFADVYEKIKQPTRDDSRDTQPNLKTPTKEASKGTKLAGAKVLTPTPVMRRIRQTGSVKVASQNLAELLFTDEADYR